MVGNERDMQENVKESSETTKKTTSVCYQIAVGRLLVLRKHYERAHDYLSTAVKEQVEVSNLLCSSYIDVMVTLVQKVVCCLECTQAKATNLVMARPNL